LGVETAGEGTLCADSCGEANKVEDMTMTSSLSVARGKPKRHPPDISGTDRSTTVTSNHLPMQAQIHLPIRTLQQATPFFRSSKTATHLYKSR